MSNIIFSILLRVNPAINNSLFSQSLQLSKCYTSLANDIFILFLRQQNHNTTEFTNNVISRRASPPFPQHRTPPRWVCRQMLRNALRSSSRWPRQPCTGDLSPPSCIWVSSLLFRPPHITSMRVIGFSYDRYLFIIQVSRRAPRLVSHRCRCSGRLSESETIWNLLSFMLTILFFYISVYCGSRKEYHQH